MIENNQIIDPKSEYRVHRNGELNATDFQILTKLYLPVIGANAFSLISSLWNSNDKLNEHFSLMNGIGIDGNELFQSRLKLEGIGLLQNFEVNDNENTYLLAKPLSASQFFQSGLLSEILLEMVGETKYLELAKELLPNAYDVSLATEITHDFLQVFSINKQNINNQPEVVKQVQNNVTDGDTPKIKQPDTLDFNLMINILSNSFVNLADVKKNHDLFISTKSLYGMDEMEMTKFVEQATNLTNNHFDAQKFKILVSRNNQRQFKPKVKETTVKSVPQQQLNSNEQQLIKTAKEYAPLIFLNAIKAEKNGFATSSEERIISQLVEKMVLKNDVINMLIYLLLVDRNYPTLNKNLVDTIANDWSQNQIQSAEQALEQIKTRDSKISAKKVERRKKANQQSRLNVKETLPDWAKDSQTKSTNATITNNYENEMIAEKLKKINQKERGDN